MIEIKKIKFQKASISHINTIFSWLAEPFVQEFWDNTQAHKDDIVNFIEGRKTPSLYADGQYTYWIASCDNHPFAMLMMIQETYSSPINEEKLNKLSKVGHTYSLDYMIGNSKFLGKGYGARTLSDFIDYFRKSIDPKADTFFIDPAIDNHKAKHVYMKAGFKHTCDFMMEGDVSFAGKWHHLLLKEFKTTTSKINNLNGVELVGEKILCQTLCMEYAKDICENFTAKITKYMLSKAPKTETEIEKHILDQQEAMSKREELALLVLKKDTKDFLGYIAIHKLNSRTPEMGIWIKEKAHSQGYGFEALSLLKKWAEKNLSFDYLKYPVEKNNLPSRALAEKLKGKLKTEYLKKNESGHILDEVEYRFYKKQV